MFFRWVFDGCAISMRGYFQVCHSSSSKRRVISSIVSCRISQSQEGWCRGIPRFAKNAKHGAPAFVGDAKLKSKATDRSVRSTRAGFALPGQPRRLSPHEFGRRTGLSAQDNWLNLLDIRLPFANNTGMAITRRQREVYDFISRFVAEHQYSPSFEEIGNGLGLNSLATVHKHITNLEKKGLLTRDYNRSRSIDLIPPKGRLKQSMSVNTGLVLPLLGRIAAGQPIEAIEDPQTISLADFVRSKEVFVLEVRGDSMQDEAILNGDYVLVEKLKTAHNGDIVVAIVDKDDATLKRFYRDGDNIRLQPSNAAMKPIIVPAASVEVQGRVIGVLRKY
jgi:repressor LexA